MAKKAAKKAKKASKAKKSAKKSAKRADSASARVLVEKAMPGWTLAGSSATDANPSGGRAQADAVSPSLGKMKAKAAGKDAVTQVKFTALKKNHAQFVRVRPASASDADGAQQKVILMRDGKIVARQG